MSPRGQKRRSKVESRNKKLQRGGEAQVEVFRSRSPGPQLASGKRRTSRPNQTGSQLRTVSEHFQAVVDLLPAPQLSSDKSASQQYCTYIKSKRKYESKVARGLLSFPAGKVSDNVEKEGLTSDRETDRHLKFSVPSFPHTRNAQGELSLGKKENADCKVSTAWIDTEEHRES